jgi:hypothetical protein
MSGTGQHTAATGGSMPLQWLTGQFEPYSYFPYDPTCDSMLEWMMLRPQLGRSLSHRVHKWVVAAAAAAAAAAEAYTAATAAVPEAVDSSALCCGLARLSVMYALAISTPLATSSARLHSSVHCSTSSFLGRRSVTLLKQCGTAPESLP